MRPITKVAQQTITPRIPMLVRQKTTPPIAIVLQPKTTPYIAMPAWQTMMLGNAVAVQQMTTPHILVAAWQNMSQLLHCLPLHRPLFLLLCHPLAALAGCFVASIYCCHNHQMHRHWSLSSTAATAAAAAAAVPPPPPPPPPWSNSLLSIAKERGNSSITTRIPTAAPM
jgi:hypothetical protein